MKKINWHRLFGLTLMDWLAGSNYQVELEKELSLVWSGCNTLLFILLLAGQGL
jgi:hypothetical protein